MSVKVSLQAVVDELDVLMEGCVAYLNAKTGELISLSEDDRMLAEEEVDPEEDIPKWQQEALPKIREVLESEDYIELPSKFDIHEYAIMENFCYSINEPRLRRVTQCDSRKRGFSPVQKCDPLPENPECLVCLQTDCLGAHCHRLAGRQRHRLHYRRKKGVAHTPKSFNDRKQGMKTKA